MGRLLVRGEDGHDIIDELQAIPGEVVVDKPGRGAFFNTNLMDKLKAKAITHLIICGVTTECCFDTTFREANDRGFECCKILLITFRNISYWVSRVKSSSLYFCEPYRLTVVWVTELSSRCFIAVASL